MAAEDLESLGATPELLEDPTAQRRIEAAERGLAAGRGVSGEDLARVMRRKSG